ncbi:MBL fold metallo-hydrolase [Atopobium sp. oral taxon 810]|uniref:MBL fold metallo-hydrolase n=1 Tax=Atopobium sp. oral taxon 810 TaxID=712158 RepID=UPI0003975BEE|nr:MBL fold metallo-hydrolase [Atopobium sp. oral taxon 810]ERI05115.1 metallo-beta-lactamase domain protein [Atopobium sp. oral taxon 810 str. F0209]
MLDMTPRPIKSELKSRVLFPEDEKPSRWSFLKVLREFSSLREFYPEINPYSEAYQFRDNCWAIYSDGNGFGEMWNYLIVGPERAMLIDTNDGIGNVRALAEYLAKGKEIICVNTHHHIDHIGGNYYFDQVFIHENDAQILKKNMTPTFFTDWALDDAGKPKYTWFDVADLPPFHEYEICTFKNADTFDLGQGYIVEAVHLPGHTAGQSGFFDHQTGCIFIGDVTSAFGPTADPDHGEYCTVNAFRDALMILQPRFDKISGVFPGHGTWDLHAATLQYLLDTCELIIAHPDWYDSKKDFFGTLVYTHNVYQLGSDMKYTMDAVVSE